LSFGDPGPFAAEVHKAGVLLVCQVQFMSDIDLALKAGAAAIVVQGTEAGGHGANRSTFPFVPEAADYLKQRSPDTLLLAAGGIADGRGLAAALVLGADGVVVGTRLWASAEALTKKAHTDKAIAVNGDSTIRTKTLDAPWGRSLAKAIFFPFLEKQTLGRMGEPRRRSVSGVRLSVSELRSSARGGQPGYGRSRMRRGSRSDSGPPQCRVNREDYGSSG